MNWRTATRIGAFVFAAIDFLAIMAPSLVLAITARQGGLPNQHGLDLIVASLVIAIVDSKVVFDRLRDEVKHAGRLLDVWISEFDSLVVLALGTNILLLFLLGGFAEQHAALINEGWPILGMWVGIQVFAVLLSELAGRLVFHWLEPDVDVHAPLPEDDPADLGATVEPERELTSSSSAPPG